MNIDEIEKLIRLFEKADISTLEVEDSGVKIKLTKDLNAQATVVTDSVPVEVKKESNPVIDSKDEDTSSSLQPGEEYIKSPLVGTYHQAPYAEAKPFVSVGSKVKKGDKLCIVEAMKVMNEITSPRDGTIKKILCSEGSMVEFDQELFVIGD